MVRFLILSICVVLATADNEVSAQRRGGQSGHAHGSYPGGGHGNYQRGGHGSIHYPSRSPHSAYRGYQRSPSFGFSIGIGGNPGIGRYDYRNAYRFDDFGYGYDPYRYGSFRAPDLLDDPRFHPRYPYHQDRFRYAVPPALGPAAPAAAYQPYRGTIYPSDLGLIRPQDAAGAYRTQSPRGEFYAGTNLSTACQQLSQSLGSHQASDVWHEYLSPNQIPALVENGETGKLRELLTHYDGVVGNSQLRSIASAPGFASVRQRLREHVGQEPDVQSIESAAPTSSEVTTEPAEPTDI